MIQGATIGGMTGALGGSLASTFSPGILSAAAGGAVNGGTSALLTNIYYGGDIGQDMLDGIISGGLSGGVSGATATHWGFDFKYEEPIYDLGRVAAEGLGEGAVQEVTGGSFKDGFLQGAGRAGVGYMRYKHYARNQYNLFVSYSEAKENHIKLN